jgi:ferredoxin
MSTSDRPLILDRDGLPRLLAALAEDGRELVGPTVRDGAIVYAPITADTDLPVGWTEEQEAGTYRLRRRDDAAVFGFTVGPQSWKRELFPPRTRICTVAITREGVRVEPDPVDAPPRAFIGVRSCELAAMGIQDRVFRDDHHGDPGYAARRDAAFIVAVQCVETAPTCFCSSMGTGPTAGPGHDLALTELLDPDRHAFLVSVGSPAGRAVIDRLGLPPATEEEIRTARARLDDAAASMGRTMETDGLPADLLGALEHPHWDEVAERCLACANCTMVCPTCFCSTVRDTADLTGEHAERWREWASCFTEEFSELHGGSVRSSVRSRYRQWLTHKLATWHEQFDSSGCVGCGRCITWCPVGIDLTAEVRALRAGGAGRTAGATGAGP